MAARPPDMSDWYSRQGLQVKGGGITLQAGGAIKGGQTAYATGTGFFLGYSGTAYKFSIGTNTQYMRFDGTNITFSGALSAATGTFSGDISGASGTFTGNLNVAGTANVDGNTYDSDSGQYAAIIAGTTSSTRWYGVVGYGASAGLLGKGSLHGVMGVASNAGGYGVYGVLKQSSSADAGVRGWSGVSTKPGVKADNIAGSSGLALQCTGQFQWGSYTWAPPGNLGAVLSDNGGWAYVGNSSGYIPESNGVVCTNLNADLLDGNHAAAFATAAHNHSGTYLPIAGTAADSSALGGYAATSWTRIVNGNVGTANASGNGFTMQMGTGLAPTYEVNCSSNNIILQTASDRSLKQDIVDETYGLAFIKALQPRKFRFISDPEYLQHGFIAQEVAAVATPNGEKDSLAFTNPNGKMGINHLSLIAPLVKAIQELEAEVQALKARLP